MPTNGTPPVMVNHQAPDALEQWDGEGGAIAAMASGVVVDESGGLTAAELHVLRRLGSAVVIIWNNLPTDVRRALFDAASMVEASEPTVGLRGQIACFLHNHKND